jgi:hypothetical protein
VRPIGNDQQIERTVPASLSIDGDRPRTFARHVDDLHAGDQTRARRQEATMQQVEQNRAADTQSECLGMQVAIGKVQHRPALMVISEQPIDPGPSRQGVLFEAKCAKYRKAGGLQEKSSAHGTRLFEALQHGDAMSGLSEEACRGLSSDAAAYDADFQGPQPHVPS